jgi:hypothetical protein
VSCCKAYSAHAFDSLLPAHLTVFLYSLQSRAPCHRCRPSPLVFQIRVLSPTCTEAAFLSLLCPPAAWATLPGSAFSALYLALQAYFLYFATKASEVQLPVRTCCTRGRGRGVHRVAHALWC